MKNIDHYFDLAKKEVPSYSYAEVNAFMQLHFTKNTQVKYFKVKYWFISLTVMGVVMIVSNLFESKKRNSTPTQHKTIIKTVVKPISKRNTIENTKPYEGVLPIYPKRVTSNGENLIAIAPFTDTKESVEYIMNLPPLSCQEKPTEQNYFPSFTQEEIDKNNKRKKEMVKDAYRLDKKQYADLYTLGFGFVMQKTEVTNLAYRTFLMDLVIQNETEKYELAKPNLDLWIQLPFGMANQMSAYYFSHPAFDNYPVLTISREGAELYCEWLSSELEKMSTAKNNTTSYLVRLPTRSEWTMAASNNGKHSPYAWDGIYLRDYRGVYLANLNTWSTAPFNSEEDGGMYSVPVTYYSPNSLGLYNMCGNAAEMVYEDLNDQVAGTAGGSWMSSPEQIKISAPDQYAGITSPSPYIGFRVVMLRSSATPR